MPACQVANPDDLAEVLSNALSRDEPALLTAKVGEMPDPWPYIHLPRVRGS
jgi:acetolactate synthase-1/2/3 large subunit